MTSRVTVAYGNGVGPEITEAVLYILREADAKLTIETIEIGERVYNMEEKTGILPFAWDSLLRTRILLKAPTLIKENYKDCSEIVRECFELTDEHKRIHSSEIYPEISAQSYVSEIFALFEPAHDSVAELAGKNKANPSAMLFAAIALLEHINQSETATRIKNAWLKTIEDGLLTADIYKRGKGVKKLGTQEFAEAVAERLGKTSSGYMAASV